jgi:hypothetical protein
LEEGGFLVELGEIIKRIWTIVMFLEMIMLDCNVYFGGEGVFLWSFVE